MLCHSAHAIPIFQNMRMSDIVPILVPEQKGERDQILPISTTSLQLFNYLEKATKLKLDVRRYPWQRVLHNAENGEGLIFGISKTPERLQIFDYSLAVYSDKIWLVARCEDKMQFKDIADLRNKTIGIVKGSTAGEHFDSAVNVIFKAEYNNSNLAGRFLKLYQRRMDAFLLYEPRSNYKRVQKELNQMYAVDLDEYRRDKLDVFCILPKPVATIDAYFAISKQADKTVLEKINRALIQARRSGELDRIYGE